MFSFESSAKSCFSAPAFAGDAFCATTSWVVVWSEVAGVSLNLTTVEGSAGLPLPLHGAVQDAHLWVGTMATFLVLLEVLHPPTWASPRTLAPRLLTVFPTEAVALDLISPVQQKVADERAHLRRRILALLLGRSHDCCVAEPDGLVGRTTRAT